MARGSHIDLVEGAHRLAPNLDAWLATIVERSTALDQGLGVVALVQTVARGSVTPVAFAQRGAETFGAFSAEVTASSPVSITDALSRREVFAGSLRHILRDVPPADFEHYFGLAARYGMHDVWGIAAQDGAGRLLALVWPTAQQRVPDGLARWRKIGFHLRTGLRVHLARNEHEAVLAPSGAVLHATGAATARAAMTQLSEGVRRLERARRLRHEPDEAIDLWRALVAGRWSLNESMESDGKRLLIAFPTALSDGSPLGLTDREHEIVRWVLDDALNKEIAYALGLSVGTVGTHLARAMQKLHVHNRAELKVLAQLAAGVRADGERITLPRVAEPALAGLSPGQRALLADLAEGRSNRQIAARHGCSVLTVRNRVSLLVDKLGVRTRSELARLAAGPGVRRPLLG